MNEVQIGGNRWKWDGVPSGCGVIAIRRKSDGKSYYLAVSDMRQRAYDHHRMLVAGTHHNVALQSAWTAAPHDFEIVAVESVRCRKLLALFKQTYIERAGNNCFNVKNGIATCTPRLA